MGRSPCATISIRTTAASCWFTRGVADAGRADGILTWLLLSGGTAAIQVSGPEGLAFSTGIINGAKFHTGQIVGGYELPANAPAETARAYRESKRFVPTPVDP